MGTVISMKEYKHRYKMPDSVAEILGIVDAEEDGVVFAKDSILKRLFDAIKRNPALAAATLNDRALNG